MFYKKSTKSEISLFFLRSLVVVIIALGYAFYSSAVPSRSATDAKSVQIISQVVLELKEANPNVEITREMIVAELRRKSDLEQLALKKKQQRLQELKAKSRAVEKRIIEKAIKSNDTGYLSKFMADKYNISSFEALDMIKNHDERAYVAVREIIMSAGAQVKK